MSEGDISKEGSDRYSLQGRVYRKLREDILSGRYKEHEELREVAIGEELGVSRTPVREAFRQLELEGLIQIIPNKGAYVVGISWKDVGDIYQMRARLEGLAAALAAHNIERSLLSEMEEIIYLSEFHAKSGHMEQLPDLDNRFHHIIYESCASKMLEKTLIELHEHVIRVRKMTLTTLFRGNASNAEHHGIMEAIKAGDAELAEKLAHEHMINAYEFMKEKIGEDKFAKTVSER